MQERVCNTFFGVEDPQPPRPRFGFERSQGCQVLLTYKSIRPFLFPRDKGLIDCNILLLLK